MNISRKRKGHKKSSRANKKVDEPLKYFYWKKHSSDTALNWSVTVFWMSF